MSYQFVIYLRGTKTPKARAYYRVFRLPICEKDKEFDYSELFELISSILIRSQPPSILHLNPIVDSLRDLAQNHTNRETSTKARKIYTVRQGFVALSGAKKYQQKA